jgi:hypothetical protein
MSYKPEMQQIPAQRCRHITSKGLRIFGDDYRTPVDEGSRTNDFWCQKTHNVLGPDKALVILSRCTPDRECYDAL